MSRTERTAEKRAAFLSALEETANVKLSCEQSGLPRQTAYDWRRADGQFAEAWEAALDIGTDALEDEAVRRAMQGTDKPVYYQGDECGTVREYSDTLLIFMLKARRPDRFKDRSHHELTGKDGGPIEHDHGTALAKIESALAVIATRDTTGGDTGGADAG